MKLIATALPGVLTLEPRVFGDERRFFMEIYRRDDHHVRHSIPRDLVQDNLSYSRRGVLRGLHLQWPHSQGKLVYSAGLGAASYPGAPGPTHRVGTRCGRQRHHLHGGGQGRGRRRAGPAHQRRGTRSAWRFGAPARRTNHCGGAQGSEGA